MIIEKIPDYLYGEFTQKGTIPINYKIIDNTTQEVQNEINANFNSDTFNKYRNMVQARESNYYGYTDQWMYEALSFYPIEGKNVCIFGSTAPWYEAMCLTYGAKSVNVIEYSDRISFDDKIAYIKPENQYSKVYDIGLSISSFEHDGLGRYGDPINPTGDLEAMQNAKKVIKKDGLMYLSVPVGKDLLCFNAHRIYGFERFYKLIENWEPIATYGFTENSFDTEYNGVWGTPYQPLIILKNS